ncbi:MAG: hypothetical protein DRJ67_06900 [Thermoprotei archaeon]|nr:MAG: hypothetical protein DRJ67_06900 [Thermoprotei archaeon]
MLLAVGRSIGRLLIGLLALASGFTIAAVVWPDAAAISTRIIISWLVENPPLLLIIIIILATLFLAAIIKDIFGLLLPNREERMPFQHSF